MKSFLIAMSILSVVATVGAPAHAAGKVRHRPRPHASNDQQPLTDEQLRNMPVYESEEEIEAKMHQAEQDEVAQEMAEDAQALRVYLRLPADASAREVKTDDYGIFTFVMNEQYLCSVEWRSGNRTRPRIQGCQRTNGQI